MDSAVGQTTAAVEPKPAARAALGASTVAEAFRITVAERENDVAIRTKGDEFTITWGELRDRAKRKDCRTLRQKRELGPQVHVAAANFPRLRLVLRRQAFHGIRDAAAGEMQAIVRRRGFSLTSSPRVRASRSSST